MRIKEYSLAYMRGYWKAMKLHKVYLVFFGAYHIPHLLPMFGLYEFMIGAPGFLPLFWWHLILLFVYGVAPILAVITNRKKLYIFVAISSALGSVIEVLKIFKWTYEFYYALAVLD
ncbi:MAG: hypothetical protein QXS05_07865, partial [Candidatus Bathyarchaeia archaeon]